METAIKNRNASFYSQIERFSLRRKTVYDLIKKYGPITDVNIAFLTVLPINSITGRRRELLETFFIKATGSEENSRTGKQNTVWDITTMHERQQLVCHEIERLKAERFTRLKDLEAMYISDLTKGDILKKVNKITELINKLEKQ